MKQYKKGIFIGTNNSLGFKKNNEYDIEITDMKRGGYLLCATQNLTTGSVINITCPYSTQNSMKLNWIIK